MQRLLGDLWLLTGRDHSHLYDASGYLFVGDEPTMIDCGTPLGYQALKAGLAELGYTPKDVKRVIGTHGHYDHISAVTSLRQESDVEFLLHEADWDGVQRGDDDLTSAFLYRAEAQPIRVDGTVSDGEVLRINGYEVEVYHTPGHTPGCVTFRVTINDVRLLIAGDTLWGGYSDRFRSDLITWRRSLDRIMGLDFDAVTFGHWSNLVWDAKPKVQRSLEGFGLIFDPWFAFEGRGT